MKPDEPVDFSSLDPRRDPARFERDVQEIRRRGFVSRSYRLRRAVSAMFAPVMAASLVLMLAAAVWLFWNARNISRESSGRADSEGVTLVQWMLDGGRDAWQDMDILRR